MDADIQAFYDTIPHKLIVDRLREKIADGWVLNRIENMLKAGVMEDGILHKTTKGTPQGGVISPLLANLALDIRSCQVTLSNVKGKELEKAGYTFVHATLKNRLAWHVWGGSALSFPFPVHYYLRPDKPYFLISIIFA